MKALVEGVWHPDLVDTPELQRARRREKARWFRARVRADGEGPHPAAPDRYHLYVSYACPWAHRTLLYRALKGLEPVISVSVCHPRWAGPDGWTFADGEHGTVDHVNGQDALWKVYRLAKPDFTGRVTVPLLWDREARTAVNNESGEIIRMLNSEFDAWATVAVDFYPEERRAEIDALNAFVLERVCTGVYAAGFAATQAAYDRAVARLFAALDALEARLERTTYLLGDRPLETDWHLFATLCRFDAAYHGALRCNVRRLIDYPNLTRYARRLYELPGVAATVRLDHVKLHYYDDLRVGHPALVPAGPAVDFRSRAAEECARTV